MFAQEKSTDVNAAPEEVYDYVSDLRRHPEWAAQELEVKELEDGQFASTVTFGPVKLKSKLHVEASERPRRLVFVSDDGLAPHRWRFEIKPQRGGSVLTFGFERMSGPVLIRIAQPILMWPLVGNPGMERGLANIKQNVERARAKIK